MYASALSFVLLSLAASPIDAPIQAAEPSAVVVRRGDPSTQLPKEFERPVSVVDVGEFTLRFTLNCERIDFGPEWKSPIKPIQLALLRMERPGENGPIVAARFFATGMQGVALAEVGSVLSSGPSKTEVEHDQVIEVYRRVELMAASYYIIAGTPRIEITLRVKSLDVERPIIGDGYMVVLIVRTPVGGWRALSNFTFIVAPE